MTGLCSLAVIIALLGIGTEAWYRLGSRGRRRLGNLASMLWLAFLAALGTFVAGRAVEFLIWAVTVGWR